MSPLDYVLMERSRSSSGQMRLVYYLWIFDSQWASTVRTGLLIHFKRERKLLGTAQNECVAHLEMKHGPDQYSVWLFHCSTSTLGQTNQRLWEKGLDRAYRLRRKTNLVLKDLVQFWLDGSHHNHTIFNFLNYQNTNLFTFEWNSFAHFVCLH